MAAVLAAAILAVTAGLSLRQLSIRPEQYIASPADASVFVSMINAVRVSHGLRGLAVYYPALTTVAQNWTNTMAAADAIWHNPHLLAQAPADWQRIGENVGMGTSDQDIEAGFEQSPEHMANMVNPSYDAVGLAVTVVPAKGALFVTEDFIGSPSAALLPVAGSTVTAAPRIYGPPSGSTGFRLATSDGAVAAYGNATWRGSAAGAPLRAPVVGIETTPDQAGYWLVGSDGGIFTYGDAVFRGSAGNLPLRAPVVGMAATPDGAGYWLVSSDGGVFSFGNAVFRGSAGSLRLRAPVVGIATTPDGGGYWLVSSDGGVFSFGNARFAGSGAGLVDRVVGIAASGPGGGYWLVTATGRIVLFSGAPACTINTDNRGRAPVVGIAGPLGH